MMRVAVCSSGAIPMWNPPSPIRDTSTPVRPSLRIGILPSGSLSAGAAAAVVAPLASARGGAPT